MNFVDEIKERFSELKENSAAEESFIGFYMMALLLSVIVLSVMFPIITQQIAAVNSSVSSAARTVMGLFLLFLALGLLIFYMKPLM